LKDKIEGKVSGRWLFQSTDDFQAKHLSGIAFIKFSIKA